MKLVTVPIHNAMPLTFRCIKCERKVNQAHAPVYADIQGKAYEDYYCQDCALQALVDTGVQS
jgi:L-lactate utilization protein LutB